MTSKSTKRARAEDADLVEAVRQSVDRIWQAGLGAFSRAQHEGEEMFSRLVQEGVSVQKRTQHLAENRLAEMTGTISKMAQNLGKQASGPLEKLEAALEDRVTRSLHSIGVPTRDDILALGAQIGKLQQTVDAALPAKRTAKGAHKLSAASVKKMASAKAEKPSKPGTARTAARASKRAAESASTRV